MRVGMGVTALAAAGGLAAIPALASDAGVTATVDNTFKPGDLTVSTGESVTWKNVGGEHNVKFEDGQYEQPSDPAPPEAWPAASLKRTFAEPGTYPYYCENHGAPGGVGMSGTVTVKHGPGPQAADEGEKPAPDSPTPRRIALTLTASDSTPRIGQRIRFFGSARPRHDGLTVYIQRRRRDGSFKTVARSRLRPAPGTRSSYSRRLRIDRDGVFRARVRGDADHAAGTSRRRRIDVR